MICIQIWAVIKTRNLLYDKLVNYMIRSKLDLVKNSLQNLYTELKSNSSPSDFEIKEAGEVLQKILLQKNFKAEEQRELIQFMTIHDMLPLFQRVFEKFETNVEAEFSRSLINNSTNVKKTVMNEYSTYSRYVISLKNEITLAKMNSKDNVLFVGSGPFPITAILIHELTHAHVDCVEKNMTSASLSNKVVAFLGYRNSIRVIHKDAMHINYTRYTMIVFAILAKPLDKLLEIMWYQITPGTRIIYRSAETIREAFYENTEQNIPQIFNEYKKGKIENKRTISSILLVKD